MRIIDSYPKVFNQVVPQACVSGNPCQWNINEYNSKAKVRQLRIFFPSCNHLCYDDSIVKGLWSSISKKISDFNDEDCDGIGIFQTDAVLKLVFVDLKSKFSVEKICQGFSQGLTSLFKMLAMMSLCEGYCTDGIKYEFIVACSCFQDEDKETRAYQDMLHMKMVKPNSFAAKVIYPLFQKGSIKVILKDFPQIGTLPFCNQLVENEVKLTLVRTAKFEDSYADYSMAI